MTILELNLVEFADAVYQFGHHLTEDRRDLGLRRGRVFDDVVQNRRDQGVGIQAQVGEDVGDRDRMRDVRLARDALLAVMLFGPEFVGFAHPLHLRGRQISLEFI